MTENEWKKWGISSVTDAAPHHRIAIPSRLDGGTLRDGWFRPEDPAAAKRINTAVKKCGVRFSAVNDIGKPDQEYIWDFESSENLRSVLETLEAMTNDKS